MTTEQTTATVEVTPSVETVTPVVETVETKTAPAKKAPKKSSKKSTPNTAPKSSKKTTKPNPKKAETKPTEKKVPAAKAEKNGSLSPRSKVTVGKEEWPAKMAAVLYVLKRAKGEDLTKPQIAEKIKAFGMSEDQVNAYCYQLRDKGLAFVSVYEGDHTHYRSASPKGLKTELPAPFNK